MAYIAINYSELAPYKVDRVAGRGIKKITWNKIASQDTNMPFDVYIVPVGDGWAWGDYVRSRKRLQQLFNCVYLLWGRDFIYTGKSIDGDRILGHIEYDETSDYDYQMLFVPNNDNPATKAYWTSDFMAYLESELIDRIKANNPYCKNATAGKNIEKSMRDLKLNADKEDFAANIIGLIVEVFMDISYCGYLLPEEKKTQPLDNDPEEADPEKDDLER